jgi:hypothetical protein
MYNYNQVLGRRLKDIRHIINEGGKLSGDQFGYLVGETRDNIANYETGRAGVPVRLLHELYKRGINPVYIISGEGSVFADNEAGRKFRAKLEHKLVSNTLNNRDERKISLALKGGNEFSDGLKKLPILLVAAGTIKKNL